MKSESEVLFGGVEVIVLSPDGTWVAAGQGVQSDAKPAPRVTLHDLPSGKLRGNPLPQTEGCQVMALSPDGKLLASVKGWSGLTDKTVNLWDLSTSQLKVELKGHSGKFRSLAFLPNGKYLASGGGDSTARIWDAATGKEIAQIKLKDEVFGLAFGPESKTLVVGGRMADVSLWDLSPALPGDRR